MCCIFYTSWAVQLDHTRKLSYFIEKKHSLYTICITNMNTCATHSYTICFDCENVSIAGTADRHCCQPFSHGTLLVLVIKVSIKKITKRNLADVGTAQCMNALADKEEVPCTQWYALHTMATWCKTVDSSVTRIKMDRYFGYTNLHDYMHVCASLRECAQILIRSRRTKSTLDHIIVAENTAWSLDYR